MHSVYIYAMALFAGAITKPTAPKGVIEKKLYFRGFDGEVTCDGIDEASDEAADYYIDEGVNYLKGLTEDGKTCAAAAGECSRVSCSHDSAIYLCNDSEEEQDSVNCASIADSVNEIRDECKVYKKPIGTRVRGGQPGSANLSVHVGRSPC